MINIDKLAHELANSYAVARDFLPAQVSEGVVVAASRIATTLGLDAPAFVEAVKTGQAYSALAPVAEWKPVAGEPALVLIKAVDDPMCRSLAIEYAGGAEGFRIPYGGVAQAPALTLAQHAALAHSVGQANGSNPYDK